MAQRPEERPTESLTMRISPEDRELLDRLVDLRQQELVDDGLEASAASVIRGLIRREARARLPMRSDGGE